MKQMKLFDFIEKPETMRKTPETKLEELFGKIDNPVTRCANCLCSRCANNMEGDIDPEEVERPCCLLGITEPEQQKE